MLLQFLKEGVFDLVYLSRYLVNHSIDGRLPLIAGKSRDFKLEITVDVGLGVEENLRLPVESACVVRRMRMLLSLPDFADVLVLLYAESLQVFASFREEGKKLKNLFLVQRVKLRLLDFTKTANVLLALV